LQRKKVASFAEPTLEAGILQQKWKLFKEIQRNCRHHSFRGAPPNDEVGGRVGGADLERVLEADPASWEALGMRRTKTGLFLALLVPGVRVPELELGRRVVV
jgi:hypothetical protein